MTDRELAAPLAELRALLEEADAAVAGAECSCAGATRAAEAYCCHFTHIGREPHVSEIELALVRRAIAAVGAPRRAPAPRGKRLPMVEDLRTCPLLSEAGRCSVYVSRPLGCRTFFCDGHGPADPARARKVLRDVARRVSDLSARVFPRSGGPRTLRRALGSLARPSGR